MSFTGAWRAGPDRSVAHDRNILLHFIRVPSGKSQKQHLTRPQATALLADSELVPLSLHFMWALHGVFTYVNKVWIFFILSMHLSPIYLEETPWEANMTWVHVFILTAVQLGSPQFRSMLCDTCSLLLKALTCFHSKMVESEAYFLLQ